MPRFLLEIGQMIFFGGGRNFQCSQFIHSHWSHQKLAIQKFHQLAYIWVQVTDIQFSFNRKSDLRQAVLMLSKRLSSFGSWPEPGHVTCTGKEEWGFCLGPKPVVHSLVLTVLTSKKTSICWRERMRTSLCMDNKSAGYRNIK